MIDPFDEAYDYGYAAGLSSAVLVIIVLGLLDVPWPYMAVSIALNLIIGAGWRFWRRRKAAR